MSNDVLPFPLTLAVALVVGSARCLAITPPLLPVANANSPPRIDKNHMPKIGHAYYPPESLKHGEQAVCVIRAEVDDDDWVRATQLVYSSGFPRLDAACSDGYLNSHFLPALREGKPAATWILLSTSWELTRPSNPKALNSPTIPKSDARLTVPIIQSPLKVGPIYYPNKAREMHLEGDCRVHTLIAKDGSPSEARITKSTGFASLDDACILAIQAAQFLPKKDQGIAVDGLLDIDMSWRLSQ